jgi:hypothetical protein
MAASEKDFWDKLGVFLHPIGGLLTAVAVAAVGYWGSQLLSQRQAADTNSRLYSELMSKREESESGLRKDMLVAVVQSFLQPDAATLDSRVLKLELLAYNFHESLNLKPLFLDLVRRVRAVNNPDSSALLQRLNVAAREIRDKQLFALEGRGRTFRRSVIFDDLAAAGRAGLPLDPETITLENKTYTVNLRVLDVDRLAQEVRVRLEVKPPPETPDAVDTRATFAVGFYDFPLIDNTRLANGQRCSLMLSAFGKAAAELTAICYPGEYASVKDRPYLDEVIQQLKQVNQTSSKGSLF